MHSMYHTTLHLMPGQLIFGRDMILNMQYLADWTAIKARKQQLICKTNIIENSKCIPYQYKVGDMVMLENHHVNKYEQPYKGPYLVMQVNTNGTVCLKIGTVTDTMNIRCFHPFKTMSSNTNHGGKCSMHHSIASAGAAYVITNNEYHICYNEHLDVYHLYRSHTLSAHQQDYMWSASPCNP